MRNVYVVESEKWSSGSIEESTPLGIYTSLKVAREAARFAHRSEAAFGEASSIAYLIRQEELLAHEEVAAPGRAWRWFPSIETEPQEINTKVSA
jgi:hypothetical protein